MINIAKEPENTENIDKNKSQIQTSTETNGADGEAKALSKSNSTLSFNDIATPTMEEEWVVIEENLLLEEQYVQETEGLQDDVFHKLGRFLQNYGRNGLEIAGRWPESVKYRNKERLAVNKVRTVRRADKEAMEAEEDLRRISLQERKAVQKVQQELELKKSKAYYMGAGNSNQQNLNLKHQFRVCGLKEVTRPSDCPGYQFHYIISRENKQKRK